MKSNGIRFATAAIFLVLAMLARQASSVDLISNLIRCAPGMTPYVVLNGEERTSGKFYGYVNAGNGPGDSAFVDAKAWADAHNTPLVVVFDTGGGNSNTFTADLNDDEDYQGGRYLLQWMNGKAGPDKFNCMFAYFKGTTTAPAACKDAYEFCTRYGAISFPCVVCYWKWPDGTIRTSATSGLSSVGSFEGPVNNFITKNKPPPYTPPKASAGFAAKDGELKATVGAELVYVPFTRTNNLATVETNWLVAAYSDGTVVTNVLEWTAQADYNELAVSNGFSKVGEKIQLKLLGTNKVSVAENSITCAAAPRNGLDFPDLSGAATGRVSLDLAAATNLATKTKGYALVVYGCAVWDDALAELGKTVFGSTDFASWCAAKKVSVAYLDMPEPETGASLFSYATASNGLSGASFLSLNGLDAAEAARLAACGGEWAAEFFGPGVKTAKIALIGQYGFICGFLRPQFNADGTCDIAENMARLDELVAQTADVSEAANDTPWGAAAVGHNLSFGNSTRRGENALSVNDSIDYFKLTGNCGDGKVVFEIDAPNAPDGALPSVGVARYDASTGDLDELDFELSMFIDGNGTRQVEFVYSIDQKDVTAGRIFAVARAYDGEHAGTAKFGGKSAFSYSVSSRKATPNPGVISFGPQPEAAIVQASTNQTHLVPLYRMLGSTGRLEVKVYVDENLTTATNRYEFSETKVVWATGETGEKYVPLTLLGSEYNDGLYDITLRIAEVEAMSGVESYFTTYTVSYGKEPADQGQLKVVSVTPAANADGRVYVRYGSEGDGSLRAEDEISLQVNRTGGKGPAAAYVGWKNGKETMRETLSWANYLTGTQTAFLSYGFPAPGKSGYTDVAVSVTSSNGVPVVKDGSTVKVRVLPYDAPLFDSAEATWSGVQYTTTATNIAALGALDGMKVKSLVKLSGSVPAGVKVTVGEDGSLAVSGTPTAGTAVSTATYWVLLSREDGGAACSMPITVTFENKALADVNPGFTASRSWTGLPLLANGRLAGLLDMTVAKNGKTSARYRMAGGKTVAFSSPGLAGVDSDGTVTLGATKTVKSDGGATEYVFSATLGADGSMEASVAYGGTAVAASAPAGAEPWSKDNTAKRFGGNYVAAFPLADPGLADRNTLCFGSSALRFRFDSESAWRKGTVMYAGTLPNGKSVSGTATLAPAAADDEVARLPLFASSSADTLSALLDIGGGQIGATGGVVPFWAHDEAGAEGLSYANDYAVVGAVWSWNAWRAAWPDGVKVSGDGVSGTVNKTSGIASGSAWKGVAIPGNGPAVLGARWRSVSLPYTGADGKERKRTVRAGEAVEVNVD